MQGGTLTWRLYRDGLLCAFWEEASFRTLAMMMIHRLALLNAKAELRKQLLVLLLPPI